MSIQHLRQFYSFVNLPYSIDETNIAELKKILLLELKHSKDGQLTVGPKVWTKNDILQLFENTFQEDSFDLEHFESKYPFIKDLAKPWNIKYDLDLQNNTVFYDPKFAQFKEQVSKLYLQNYVIELKKALREERFNDAKAMISYADFFEEEVLLDVKGNARALLLQILNNNLNTRKTSLVFLWTNYEAIVNFAADGDSDFLFQQLQLVEKYYSKLTVEEATKALRIQLKLDHPVDIKLQLQEFIKNFESKNPKYVEEKKSTSYWIYLIIAIIAIGARIVTMINRNTHRTNFSDTPTLDYELMRKIQQIRQHASDSLLDVYNLKVDSIQTQYIQTEDTSVVFPTE